MESNSAITTSEFQAEYSNERNINNATSLRRRGLRTRGGIEHSLKVSSSSQEKLTTNNNQNETVSNRGSPWIYLLYYILKFDFAAQPGLLIYMSYNSDPPAFINLFTTYEFVMFMMGKNYCYADNFIKSTTI